MFQRLANLVRGFFGLFISGVEKRNPEALLEVEKENLRKQIGQFNQGLAIQAGLCERLKGQIAQLEKQQNDLRARTSANLKAGNMDLAGQQALQLQTVTRELEENRGQAQAAESTYANLVKSRDVAIKAAKDKIESLKYAIGDLKVKKAMAELTEMASGMISTIGGAGDNLDRLTSMVDEERTKAAGRARVATDSLNMTDVNMKQSEQNALANQALADFAAKEGIALDKNAAATDAAADTTKSMGPVSDKV